MIAHDELELIAKKWDGMTTQVLSLKELSILEMQVLLRDTYMALRQFHKELLIPKEITKILLNIEEYLYFASLMEDHEVPEDVYFYRQVYIVAKAFKEGFFNASYTYAFPQLQIFDECKKTHIINLDGNFLSL